VLTSNIEDIARRGITSNGTMYKICDIIQGTHTTWQWTKESFNNKMEYNGGL
jgi:hypothetical protein